MSRNLNHLQIILKTCVRFCPEWKLRGDFSKDFNKKGNNMKKLIFILVSATAILTVNANDEWKDKFFKMYPEADTNMDGELSWPEFKAHNTMLKEYLKKHPEADADKNGKMSMKEYRKHKKENK